MATSVKRFTKHARCGGGSKPQHQCAFHSPSSFLVFESVRSLPAAYLPTLAAYHLAQREDGLVPWLHLAGSECVAGFCNWTVGAGQTGAGTSRVMRPRMHLAALGRTPPAGAQAGYQNGFACSQPHATNPSQKIDICQLPPSPQNLQPRTSSRAKHQTHILQMALKDSLM